MGPATAPRRARMHTALITTMLLVGALVGPRAATAAETSPAPRATTVTVSLPTWQSHYDWAGGDGYSGWERFAFGPSAEGYGLEAGLGQQPGIWQWLRGDREYRPGGAEWILRAPGTTRIASATLSVRSAPKLYAHHCVEVGLRVGLESRAARRDCSPPTEAEAPLQVALSDPSPAPTAKETYVRVEMPVCKNPKDTACSKWIPALDPLANGHIARTERVDLVLVDDDLPLPRAAGAFRDLHGTYINGRETYALLASATDAGAGVEHVALEHAGHGDLHRRAASCDTRHRTAELGSRICPPSHAATANVATDRFSEGRHDFRVRAGDLAGNRAWSDPWYVLIDRTAPAPPEVELAGYDDSEQEMALSYQAGTVADPALPTGEPGSGVVRSGVRYRLPGGDFSDWQTPATATLQLWDIAPGTAVEVEAMAEDAVGNVAVKSESITARALESDDIDAVEFDPDEMAQPIALVNYDPRFSPKRLAADEAVMASAKRPFPCLLGRSGEKVSRTHWWVNDEIKEENVYVRGKAYFRCDDPRGAAGVSKMYLKVCIQIRRPETGKFVDAECDDDDKSFDEGPVLGRIDIAPEMLCRPTPKDYRTRVYAKLSYFFPDPKSGKRSTSRSYWTPQYEKLNCNEGGAWRTLAQRGITSPSGLLGSRLRTAGDLPPGPDSGWAAHHIVPAGYKSRANAAQALAYTCFFVPNQAHNGVWLRGDRLRAKGEGDPAAKEDSDGYRDLPSYGKRRAYHPSLHTKTHFNWVADQLERAIYTRASDGERDCDNSDAHKILDDISTDLKYDRAPMGKGDVDTEEHTD